MADIVSPFIGDNTVMGTTLLLQPKFVAYGVRHPAWCLFKPKGALHITGVRHPAWCLSKPKSALCALCMEYMDR